MVYEDYLVEMDKATEDFKKDLDNEIYHEMMDELIVKFLRNMGYTEMADKYDKASEYFWYS